MRICLFTDADVFAGTERHMLDLGRGIRRESVEVYLAAPTPSALFDKARDEGLPFIPIQKRRMLDHTAIRILSRMLDSGELDLIHAHNGRTAFFTALALQQARRGWGVATQHFVEPNHVTTGGARRAVSTVVHRWVSREIDHFIAVSEAVRDGMLARGEVSPQKLTVIPNGLEPPDRSRLRPVELVRAELGIPSYAPMIVSAARLEQEKDLASLITAMSTVSRWYPGARCTIAGEGTLRNELQTQIRESHLEHIVSLLGFRQDVLSIIHAADLFVLPSLAEPFGLVLLEAMALSKPVIATRAGGPREIVVDGETGLLTLPASPPALAEAILALLSNPDRCKAMGAAGHERFGNSYTSAQMSKATVDVYRKVLSGAAPQRDIPLFVWA